ncbi:MAG: hypothetical protein NVS4B3_15320 [Gemmatimonadaceae bacterium]
MLELGEWVEEEARGNHSLADRSPLPRCVNDAAGANRIESDIATERGDDTQSEERGRSTRAYVFSAHRELRIGGLGPHRAAGDEDEEGRERRDRRRPRAVDASSQTERARQSTRV